VSVAKSRGEDAVARARAAVGTRFVAQGRDVAIGLDCVGLVMHAHRIGPREFPDDYRLAGAHREAVLRWSAFRFRRVPRPQVREGDIILFRLGAVRWHLGLWSGEGLIHADLASRRIVERPGRAPWPVAAVLRARTRFARGK
jgi:cell wall-associated NlpC family hydrolase